MKVQVFIKTKNLVEMQAKPVHKITIKSLTKKSKFPWSNTYVRSSGELYPYLSERLPNFQDYLPCSITLFSDLEIEESDIINFLEELPFQLEREFRLRKARLEQFINLDLLREQEIYKILTGHRHIQPWALYFSRDGGLGILAQETEGDLPWGIVPCSSMPNHGVAWKKTLAGYYQTWLATDRKKGQNWDWDSDIGHESAHAAFAPVPLFAQALHLNPKITSLDSVNNLQELNANHLARMSYIYSEIAVIAIRGEQRNTETGLPILAGTSELYAFLELSHKLMPELQFDRALTACRHVYGQIDFNDSIEIFQLAAPVMRVLPHISKLVNCFAIPTINWFQLILK